MEFMWFHRMVTTLCQSSCVTGSGCYNIVPLEEITKVISKLEEKCYINDLVNVNY